MPDGVDIEITTDEDLDNVLNDALTKVADAAINADDEEYTEALQAVEDAQHSLEAAHTYLTAKKENPDG